MCSTVIYIFITIYCRNNYFYHCIFFFRLTHSYHQRQSSRPNAACLTRDAAESSLTRTSILIKEKGKRVEEMLIVQIADKTNPQAGPMIVPPLRPYAEKRLYEKGRIKKKDAEIEYLIQLMAWNPEAPSLQPVVNQGILIPSGWALQGQMLFLFEGEHAVFIRYSRDVRFFGTKVSEKGDDWNKDSLGGIEKKVYETFRKTFIGMADSLRF